MNLTKDKLVQIIRNLVNNAIKFNTNNHPIFVIIDKKKDNEVI